MSSTHPGGSVLQVWLPHPKAAKNLRTASLRTSTFSCDIAYAVSPAG